uniref:(northern house mosquito) hypothetical protein n=1 Tax=Culex pipiens TaxID=7175 RepID=A0A8D8H3B7_CULPI
MQSQMRQQQHQQQYQSGPYPSSNEQNVIIPPQQSGQPPSGLAAEHLVPDPINCTGKLRRFSSAYHRSIRDTLWSHDDHHHRYDLEPGGPATFVRQLEKKFIYLFKWFPL